MRTPRCSPSASPRLASPVSPGVRLIEFTLLAAPSSAPYPIDGVITVQFNADVALSVAMQEKVRR